VTQAGGPAPGGPVPDPAAGAGAEADRPGAGAPSGDAPLVEQLAEDATADTGDSLEADEGGDSSHTGTGSDADSDVIEAVELARRFEAERDEYLDHLRRLQAEFENFKRRVEAQAADVRDRAAIELVRELLPVLDACDAAVSHGNEEVAPIRTQLLQTLEKQGLQPVDEAGVPFDPNVHEAVMHEEGEGESVVAEVMRTGYLWRNNVVRAAMVKVRG
jgi:molecular chaperone GrpE